MIKDLGPKVPINLIFAAPPEDDPHYHDFDEGPSFDSSFRREMLVDEIVSLSRGLVEAGERKNLLKADMIAQRQFMIGNPYSYSIKGVQIGEIAVVQQKLLTETEYERRPLEILTVEFPNQSGHPVMSKMPIRAVISLGKNAESTTLGAFGFITDPARHEIYNLCKDNELWAEWLLANFTFPGYESDHGGIGASMVAISPFSNSDLAEIRSLLEAASTRQP